jgi:acetyltransferase-like isoleucine patch superfamily enzyme
MGPVSLASVKISKYTKIDGLEKIEFGQDVIIDDFVFIYAKKTMKIGNYVHIGCFSSLNGGEELVIDDFSVLSMGCRIYTDSIDLKNWGLGNIVVPEEYRNVTYAPVRLGKFVLIGANSLILPGVMIGEGAAVEACSVVTQDLNPWGIYSGNSKVGDRDEEAVMRTYRRFVSKTPVDKRKRQMI